MNYEIYENNYSLDKEMSESSYKITSNNSSIEHSSKLSNKDSNSSSSNSYLIKRLEKIHKLIMHKLIKNK